MDQVRHSAATRDPTRAHSLPLHSICIINIRFRMAFKAQGRSLSDLPFRAPLFPYLPILAIILGACMFAAQGWAATTYDVGLETAPRL